jgi:DNA-binding FadR family transcriptional regulator
MAFLAPSPAAAADDKVAKLSAGIYQKILESIVSGEFAVDARLPSEAELSRRFSASRPVVREALARLRVVFGMNLTRSLSLLRTAERLRLVQDEHIAIVAAIEARDRPRARAAMETHIENARHRMFEGAPAKRV